MPRTPLLALLFHTLVSAVAVTAGAQDRGAPSQALATDPAPPLPFGAATVDPVGMAFGEWTARFELGLHPAHAVSVEAGYRDSSLSRGIAFELGYHLHPMGEGIDGPFVGPTVGVAIPTDRSGVSLFGALEVGWQLVLGPFALGLSGGLEAHFGFEQGVGIVLTPRMSVSVGYAFR